MRSTILQQRFDSLGFIIVEKDVIIDKLSVLNTNMRINLIL